MILIVGLGNPGTKYSLTRHNVGFMAVDYLKDKYNLGSCQNKFNSEITQGFINDHKVLLAKPMTYMNLSGQPVSSIISYYKLQTNNFFVIQDDIDLDVGKIKLKLGGGTAGHNGLKSIDSSLGHNNYYRIRIGIGKPQTMEVADYVLGKLSPEEYAKISESIKIISENIDLLLSGKLEEFQNKINRPLE